MWWSGQLVAMVSSVGPWFAISTSLALICLSVSGMVFSKATLFLLPWQFWGLVTSVSVMKEFVFPSCPVLTTSRGFVVGPGRLSGIVFIINACEVGLGCLLQSRRSVAMVTVMAEGAVGGTDWSVCVVTVSILANSGSGPVGKAIAMMLSASLCAASTILFASAGLEINWFTGLVVGVG